MALLGMTIVVFSTYRMLQKDHDGLPRYVIAAAAGILTIGMGALLRQHARRLDEASEESHRREQESIRQSKDFEKMLVQIAEIHNAVPLRNVVHAVLALHMANKDIADWANMKWLLTQYHDINPREIT